MARLIKSFDDLVGHKNLIGFLKQHIEKDDIADVIILHGNPGIGKSAIAKLLAIEVTTRHSSPDLKQKYTEAVIEKAVDTDSIKFFNMSEIQEKEEEIQRVKAEMNLSFSSTKRKVLILDEAHNMSKKAQDAILTELEHLQKGLYVIICTTEIGALREALQSRGKATFRLSDLSEVEAKKLLASEIARRKLSFNINTAMAISLICGWAGNQPRKMCNLLENFTEGSVVTSSELEVFLNVTTASSVIELIKYVYGSMTLGIAYLDSLKYDESFVSMLIEVTKVALGHTSNSLSPKDMLYVKEFMADKDPLNLIQFTAEVAGLSDLRKRRVISAFMKAHVSFKSAVKPAQMSSMVSRSEDMATLAENVEHSNIYVDNDVNLAVPSLEELFNSAEVIEAPDVPISDSFEVGKAGSLLHVTHGGTNDK